MQVDPHNAPFYILSTNVCDLLIYSTREIICLRSTVTGKFNESQFLIICLVTFAYL